MAFRNGKSSCLCGGDSVSSDAIKGTVRVLPTSDLSTYVPAGSGVGKTLTSPNDLVSNNTQDGVALAIGDRVLVATAGGSLSVSNLNNGIYRVTSLANGAGVELVLTRTSDADQNSEVLAGLAVFVTEGAANADTGWLLSTNNPIVVDTTPLRFIQFTGTPATAPGIENLIFTTEGGLVYSLSGELVLKAVA